MFEDDFSPRRVDRRVGGITVADSSRALRFACSEDWTLIAGAGVSVEKLKQAPKDGGEIIVARSVSGAEIVAQTDMASHTARLRPAASGEKGANPWILRFADGISVARDRSAGEETRFRASASDRAKNVISLPLSDAELAFLVSPVPSGETKEEIESIGTEPLPDKKTSY